MSWLKVGKNLLFIILLVVLAMPAVYPLVKSGFITTDDSGWMIIRLSAFYDTIIDGQIPARFLERLNFGYGYPVSNFLYPGFLYLGTLIHGIGFSFIDSIKILFGLSIIFSALFCFIWLRRLFDNTDSLIGSLVYVYSPYHLFDIYKRGSLGEAISLSVLPLAFYAIEANNKIFISLSVFLILISHNTLALFFLPFIVIYSVVRSSFKRSILPIILGAGMSSFFTVPALYELRYTKFSNTIISDPLEYFAGFDLVSYVSVTVFVFFVVFVIGIYRGRYKTIPYIRLALCFVFIFAVSYFLSSSLSTLIWSNINSSFVQFPFRMLSIFIVSISFMSAFLLYILNGFKKYIVAFIILISLIVSSFGILNDVKYEYYPDEYYSTNESTTTIHNEYMPKWTLQNPTARPNDKIEIVSGNVVIKDEEIDSSHIRFSTMVESDSVVRVNTLYWPGWKLFVDDEPREILYDNPYGVMEFELQQYDNKVYLVFGDDIVRSIANLLTLVSVFGLIYIVSKPILKF